MLRLDGTETLMKIDLSIRFRYLCFTLASLVIVIGWKILQSIIGSIGWDTIDNFPIINRMYIKIFPSFYYSYRNF